MTATSAVGAAVLELELALQPERGLHFGAPVGLAIGPRRQHQRHARPSIRAAAATRKAASQRRAPSVKSGRQFVRINVRSEAQAEGARRHIQAGVGLQAAADTAQRAGW